LRGRIPLGKYRRTPGGVREVEIAALRKAHDPPKRERFGDKIMRT
jgi:hypothetical protein